MHDNIAMKLEHAGLWRRAATRWLVVMDKCTDDALREKIALQRLYCLNMAGALTPEQRRYQNKKRYRAQKAAASY